jgi:hypothetical protein
MRLEAEKVITGQSKLIENLQTSLTQSQMRSDENSKTLKQVESQYQSEKYEFMRKINDLQMELLTKDKTINE